MIRNKLSERLKTLHQYNAFINSTAECHHSSSGLHDVNKLKNIYPRIPEAKGLPFVGTMFSLIAAGGAQKLHLYVDKRHKELGPIFREKIGPVSAVFIAEPDEMRRVFSLEGKYPKHHLPEAWLLYNELFGCKRGLLFMDEDEWLHYRRIMNNTMLKLNTSEILSAVELVANNLVQKWKNRGIQDLNKELYRWSLDVLLSILLSPATYSTAYNNLSPIIERLAEIVHEIFLYSAKLSLIPAAVAMKMRLPIWKKFVSAVDSAILIGNQLVDTIQSYKGKGLLEKFMEAGIDDQNLKRIVTDLILAAGDTTAYSTQWLMYLLATNQNKQHSLISQIKSKSGEALLQCDYLKGSLKEALRLYPVAPFLTRILPNDAQLGVYNISAGELILLSLYTSGRDEKYFPNPETFQPERWLRHQKGYMNVKSPYASLPFAMGARSCIGKKIAEIQIMATMGKVLQNFKLETKTHHTDMILQLISVPSKPIVIQLKEL